MTERASSDSPATATALTAIEPNDSSVYASCLAKGIILVSGMCPLLSNRVLSFNRRGLGKRGFEFGLNPLT